MAGPYIRYQILFILGIRNAVLATDPSVTAWLDASTLATDIGLSAESSSQKSVLGSRTSETSTVEIVVTTTTNFSSLTLEGSVSAEYSLTTATLPSSAHIAKPGQVQSDPQTFSNAKAGSIDPLRPEEPSRYHVATSATYETSTSISPVSTSRIADAYVGNSEANPHTTLVSPEPQYNPITADIPQATLYTSIATETASKKTSTTLAETAYFPGLTRSTFSQSSTESTQNPVITGSAPIEKATTDYRPPASTSKATITHDVVSVATKSDTSRPTRGEETADELIVTGYSSSSALISTDKISSSITSSYSGPSPVTSDDVRTNSLASKTLPNRLPVQSTRTATQQLSISSLGYEATQKQSQILSVSSSKPSLSRPRMSGSLIQACTVTILSFHGQQIKSPGNEANQSCLTLTIEMITTRKSSLHTKPITSAALHGISSTRSSQSRIPHSTTRVQTSSFSNNSASRIVTNSSVTQATKVPPTGGTSVSYPIKITAVPVPPVILVGGQRITANDHGGFRIGSQTLFPGGAITQGRKVMTLPQPHAAKISSSVARLYLVGENLSVGGEVTVNGRVLSLAPGGSVVVVESAQVSAPSSQATPAISRIDIGGQTLSAGGRITVGGNILSMQTNGPDVAIATYAIIGTADTVTEGRQKNRAEVNESPYMGFCVPIAIGFGLYLL